MTEHFFRGGTTPDLDGESFWLDIALTLEMRRLDMEHRFDLEEVVSRAKAELAGGRDRAKLPRGK